MRPFDIGEITRVVRTAVTRTVQQMVRNADAAAITSHATTNRPSFSPVQADAWLTALPPPPPPPAQEPPEPPAQRTDRLLVELAAAESSYQQLRDANRDMPGAGPVPHWAISEQWDEVNRLRGELRASLTDQVRAEAQKSDPAVEGDPYVPIASKLLAREVPESIRPYYETAVEQATQEALSAPPANRSEARTQRQAAIARLETINATHEWLIVQYVQASDADRPAILEQIVGVATLEQAQLGEVKAAFDAEYVFIDEMSQQARFDLRPYERKEFESLPISPTIRQEVMAAAGVDAELADRLFAQDGSTAAGQPMLDDPQVARALESGDPQRVADAVARYRAAHEPAPTTPDARRDAAFERTKALTSLGSDIAARIEQASADKADEATLAALELQYYAIRESLDQTFLQQADLYADPQDLATFDDLIEFLTWQRDQFAATLADAQAEGDAQAVAAAQDAWIKADGALQDTLAAREVLARKIEFEEAQSAASAAAAEQVAPTEKMYVGPGPWPSADVVDAIPMSSDPEHQYTYVVDGESTSWMDEYGGAGAEWPGIELTEDITGGFDRRFVDLYATGREGIHDPGDLYNPLAGIANDPSKTQLGPQVDGKWTVQINSAPSVSYRGEQVPFENITVWEDDGGYKFRYELKGEEFEGRFNDADARLWEAGLAYRDALDGRTALQEKIQPLDRDQLRANAATYDDKVCDLDYLVSAPAHRLLEAELELIADPSNAQVRDQVYDATQSVRASQASATNDAKAEEAAAEQPELDALEHTIALMPAGAARDAMAKDLETRRDDLVVGLRESALEESIQRDRLLRMLDPAETTDGSEYDLFQQNPVELARPVLENFYLEQPQAAVPAEVGSIDEARRYVMRAFGVESTSFDSLSKDDREFFGKIADQIFETAGADGTVTTLPVVYHSDEEGIKMQLVFGVETAGGSNFLVDLDGSRFDSESDYRHNNRTMQAKGEVMSVMPAGGWPVYDDQGHLVLSVGDARIESGWETFRRVTHVDLAVAVLATGAAVVIAVGSGGLGTPVSAGLLAASWGVVIASSAYGAYNAVDGLKDAHDHGRTLSLADAEARANWLSLSASVLPMPAVLRSSRAMLTAGKGAAAGLAASEVTASASATASAADAATSATIVTARAGAGTSALNRVIVGAEQVGSLSGKVGAVEQAYHLAVDWSDMTTGQREEALLMTAIDAGSGFLTTRAHDWSASRYAPAETTTAPVDSFDAVADRMEADGFIIPSRGGPPADADTRLIVPGEPEVTTPSRLILPGEPANPTGRLIVPDEAVGDASAASPDTSAATETVTDAADPTPVDSSPQAIAERLEQSGFVIAGLTAFTLPLPSDIHAHLGNDCAGQYDRTWLDNPQNLQVLARMTSESLTDPSIGPKIVFQVVPQAVPHGERYYLARNDANQPYQVPVVYHFKEGVLEVKGLVDPDTGKVIVQPSVDRRPDLHDRMLREVYNRRIARGDDGAAVRSQMPESYSTFASVAPGFPLAYEGMVSDLQAMRNLRAVVRQDERLASRFYLGLTAPDPGTPLNAAQLREMLWVANQIDPQGTWLKIFGLGETTLAKEGVTHQLIVPPDLSDPESIHALLRQTDEIGAAVVIHSDSGEALLHAARGDASRTDPHRGVDPTLILDATSDYKNVDKLFEIFAEHPGTPIIWAHAGGLGRTVRPGPEHITVLRRVLDDTSLNHVRIDLSWDVVNRYLADPRLRDGLVDLVHSHPERFIYGSDAISPRQPDVYYAALDTLRDTGFVSKLQSMKGGQDTLEKFLRGNFDEVVEQSTENIKQWRLANRDRLEAEFANNHSPAVEDALFWIHDGFGEPGAGALPPPSPDGDDTPPDDAATAGGDTIAPLPPDGDPSPSTDRRRLLTWKNTATGTATTALAYITSPRSIFDLPIESLASGPLAHGIAWTMRGTTLVLATAFPNTRAGAWAAQWRSHVNAGTYAVNWGYHVMGFANAAANGDRGQMAINGLFGLADAALGLKSSWDIRTARAKANGDPAADAASTRNADIANVAGLTSIGFGGGALAASRAIDQPDAWQGVFNWQTDTVAAAMISATATFKAYEGARGILSSRKAGVDPQPPVATVAPSDATTSDHTPRWYRDEKTGKILWSAKVAPTVGLGIPLAYYGLRLGAPIVAEAVDNIEFEDDRYGFDPRATSVGSPGSNAGTDPTPAPTFESPTLAPGVEPDDLPQIESEDDTPPDVVGEGDGPTGEEPVPTDEPPAAVPVEVVVEPGDSLWRIAARHVDQVLSAEERAAIGAPGSDLETWNAMIRLIEINPQRDYDQALLDGVVTASERDPDLLLPGSRVRVSA